MGRRLGRTNAEKRGAVLEAAAVLVAQRGRQVSLAEICSRAGEAASSHCARLFVRGCAEPRPHPPPPDRRRAPRQRASEAMSSPAP